MEQVDALAEVAVLIGERVDGDETGVVRDAAVHEVDHDVVRVRLRAEPQLALTRKKLMGNYASCYA